MPAFFLIEYLLNSLALEKQKSYIPRFECKSLSVNVSAVQLLLHPLFYIKFNSTLSGTQLFIHLKSFKLKPQSFYSQWKSKDNIGTTIQFIIICSLIRFNLY